MNYRFDKHFLDTNDAFTAHIFISRSNSVLKIDISPLWEMYIIGSIHGFSCINICRVPRKLLGLLFKLLRDPVNVYALKQLFFILMRAVYMIPQKLTPKTL